MPELRTAQYRHLIETYHLEGKTFFEALAADVESS